MFYTEKCPKCGAEQTGLDLKESEGWVECNNCRTKFKVDLDEGTTDEQSKNNRTKNNA